MWSIGGHSSHMASHVPKTWEIYCLTLQGEHLPIWSRKQGLNLLLQSYGKTAIFRKLSANSQEACILGVLSGSESCADKWTMSSFHVGFSCSVPLPQMRILAPLLDVHNHHTHTCTHTDNTKTKLMCILLEHCVKVRLWGHGRSLHYKNYNLKLIIGHSSTSLKCLLTPLTHLDANLSTREILSPFFCLLLYSSFSCPKFVSSSHWVHELPTNFFLPFMIGFIFYP